jgi:hypothetical protein
LSVLPASAAPIRWRPILWTLRFPWSRYRGRPWFQAIVRVLCPYTGKWIGDMD